MRLRGQRVWVNGARVGMLIAAWAVIGGLGTAKDSGHETSSPSSAPSGMDVGAGQHYEGYDLVMRIYFKPLPGSMPGASEDTPRMVALGRKLFFERAISRKKTRSCNDCHRLDDGQAGVDYLRTSQGDAELFGPRNAPTVLNAGFQIAQFWDGRSGDLVDQAKGPILNSIEMGMDREEVQSRLKGIEEYVKDFEAAFPDDPDPVSFDNTARALAAFERTLITPSRFDRRLRGEKGAFTEREERGMVEFMETGCMQCHNSHPVGGRMFQELGVYNPYENRSDQGRFEVTKEEADKMVFKVPMLRNVTLTPPYFHDGRISTLQEAVRLMGWLQLNKRLEKAEVDLIMDFLRSLESEKPLAFGGT